MHMSGKVFPERGVTEKGPPTLKVVGFMDWSYRLSKKGKRKKIQLISRVHSCFLVSATAQLAPIALPSPCPHDGLCY